MLSYHVPYLSGREMELIGRAVSQTKYSGEGPMSSALQKILEGHFVAPFVATTPSCTAALEMAVLLAGVGPGDEVIMPSFTFSSTATAVTLLGAIPVFVDIREDTLNLDEKLIEAAVTKKTKAICPVHYAGTSCNMRAISKIANDHRLVIIEDAAQAIGSTYSGKPVGIMGHFSAFSFHDTKNIHCGEGGALVVNRPDFVDAAKIARDKGTNRAQFVDGLVDKYTWCARGSSYLMSDFQAAILTAQWNDLEKVTQKRLEIWGAYNEGLAALEREGLLKRPVVPQDCTNNGHIFAIVLEDVGVRKRLQQHLRDAAIAAQSHYIPLHSSPAGQKLGRISGSMAKTDRLAESLLRLPIHTEMSLADAGEVVRKITVFFG